MADGPNSTSLSPAPSEGTSQAGAEHRPPLEAKSESTAITLDHVTEETVDDQGNPVAAVSKTPGTTTTPPVPQEQQPEQGQEQNQVKRPKGRARLRSLSPAARNGPNGGAAKTAAAADGEHPDAGQTSGSVRLSEKGKSKNNRRNSLGNLLNPVMGRTDSDATRLVSNSAIESADDAKVIAFVNCSSGGNEGAAVMKSLQAILGVDSVFDIKADKGPERGLELHATDPRVEVRAIVAGGDGTFSWVANAVDQEDYRNVRLVIIPLGSGNDMSRALGWGKKYCGLARVPEMVKWAREAPAHRMDVWRLEAVNAPSAGVSGSMDGDGINHGARPLVCNYLSLGADAHVELRFNQRRWNAPEKYKSRLGNFRAHMLVGLKYITQEETIRVAEHVESLVVDGKTIELPQNLQALIFCNIPSYGAGTQPWGFPRATSKRGRPMFVNDGQFEVIGLKSLHHFNRIKVGLLGAHGVRLCQGTEMEIKLKAPRTPFQVDGEPWEQLGGSVTLGRGNPVGVLPGPYFRLASKKNAKFDATGSLDREPSANHVVIPDQVVDDINVGSPRADRKDDAPELGPTLASARPTASFG